MIVKIGNTYYNSTQDPILLILAESEKEHIANMSEENKKYCSFPDDSNIDKIKEFMDVPEWILKCIDYIRI